AAGGLSPFLRGDERAPGSRILLQCGAPQPWELCQPTRRTVGRLLDRALRAKHCAPPQTPGDRSLTLAKRLASDLELSESAVVPTAAVALTPVPVTVAPPGPPSALRVRG